MPPSERSLSQQDLEPLRSSWTTAFWVFLVCFFLALAVVVLRTPYELWDESRYANNAIEMVLSHNWMVLQYGGTVDRWITEPPALIWVFAGLVRAGVKLPYAIRLPGLLAGLLTTVTIYLTADRLLGRRFVAIAASLIFLSSMLYFGPHVGLNGDFDAPLCFLITVGALSLWAFFYDVNGAGTRWVALSGAMLAVAIMTKGFAGLQLMPGYLLYALIDPVARRKLADKRLWISLGLALGLCAAYYVSRSRVDPDYWQRVMRNEIFGRMGSTIEGHVGGPLFHIKRMAVFFEPGFVLSLLAIVGLGSGWASDKRSASLSRFCLVVSLVTILLLSLSKTKLPYYTVNTEPLLALFAAVGLADFLRRSSRAAASPTNTAHRFVGLALCVLFLFAAGSLALTAVRTAHRRRAPDVVRFVNDQHTLAHAAADRATLLILAAAIPKVPFSPAYEPFGQMVKNEAALQGDYAVGIVGDARQLPAGAWVVSCEKGLFEPLLQAHRVRVAETNGLCIAGPVVGN